MELEADVALQPLSPVASDAMKALREAGGDDLVDDLSWSSESYSDSEEDG